MSFFPRFWKWLQFADKQGALKVTFSFFSVEKNASFQYSCVKVVKAKKCKSLGTRPRVTCAREKPLFFEQNVTLIMSAPSRRNSPDFYIPFCRILAPNGTIVSNLMKRMALPSRYYDFAPWVCVEIVLLDYIVRFGLQNEWCL